MVTHLRLVNFKLMSKFVIKKIIKPFVRTLNIEGDKSLSIRWALIASQAIGKSYAKNLLKSDDVLNTLNCLKKLGTKIKKKRTGMKFMV